MLPWDFKILKVACYVHVAASLATVAFLFYINWPHRFYHFTDILTFSAIIFCFIILIAYGLTNIYLLERKFPNQLPSVAFNTLNVVLTIFFILIYIIVVIITVAITIEKINSDPETGRQFKLISIILLWSLTVSGIPLVYTPVSLRKAIKANARLELEHFLKPEES